MTTIEKEFIVFATTKQFAIPVDKNKDPMEMYENATVKYSPILTSNGSVRGVDISDEKKLPEFVKMIGVSPNSPEWDSRVDEFYWDFEVPIPFATVKDSVIYNGLRLNASYEIKDGIKVPKKLRDFILYNLMMQDNKVCKDINQHGKSNYYEFFMIDVSEEKKKQEEKAQQSKKVTIELAKILSQSDTEEGLTKLRQIVGLLGVNVSSISAVSMSASQCIGELYKISTQKPDKLLALLGDKYLANRLKATQLIDANIITVSDEKYYYKDELIGKYSDLIKFLSSSENQDIVNNMESVLQQFILMSNLEEINSL